jgi:hypothetical protein
LIIESALLLLLGLLENQEDKVWIDEIDFVVKMFNGSALYELMEDTLEIMKNLNEVG